MNNLLRAYREAGGAAEEYTRRYFRYLNSVIERVDVNAVARFVRLLEEARVGHKAVFFVGNGGSAATCSHFANDLIKAHQQSGTPGFRVISLTDNLPLITALANDDGYEAIFTGQMTNLFSKGDILIAISASGNSPNIVAAAKLAHQLEGHVVGIVGFDGGQLHNLSDLVIHVQTEKGEYGPVEDVHMILDHLVTSYISFVSQHANEQSR